MVSRSFCQVGSVDCGNSPEEPACFITRVLVSIAGPALILKVLRHGGTCARPRAGERRSPTPRGRGRRADQQWPASFLSRKSLEHSQGFFKETASEPRPPVATAGPGRACVRRVPFPRRADDHRRGLLQRAEVPGERVLLRPHHPAHHGSGALPGGRLPSQVRAAVGVGTSRLRGQARSVGPRRSSRASGRRR